MGCPHTGWGAGPALGDHLQTARSGNSGTSRRTVDFPLKPLSAATFGDDVPVVRAGSPLLQLLGEGEQIKACKQTDERRRITIAMWVAFSLDLVDDESVGSDRAANAVIRIAGRQHVTCSSPAGRNTRQISPSRRPRSPSVHRSRARRATAHAGRRCNRDRAPAWRRGLTLSMLLSRTETDHIGRLVRAKEQFCWTDPETGYVRRQIAPAPGSDIPLDVVQVELPVGATVGTGVVGRPSPSSPG
jgi:hypothetical protein